MCHVKLTVCFTFLFTTSDMKTLRCGSTLLTYMPLAPTLHATVILRNSKLLTPQITSKHSRSACILFRLSSCLFFRLADAAVTLRGQIDRDRFGRLWQQHFRA